MTPSYFGGNPAWVARRVASTSYRAGRRPSKPSKSVPRHTLFGTDPSPPRATAESVAVVRPLADDPLTPIDVATAARAIIASYEHGTKLLREHVEMCVKYLYSETVQNRFGR